MLITSTVTKKILETLVHETFSTFGNLSSSSLLDSLKLLGFYYATNAGVSINIEDLRTPDLKKELIATAKAEVKEVSNQWQEGYVSDTERFQTIIDSWNFATESLKNRIVDYYEDFDPANNLYIMAFSGARGNVAQVRQLVGMRGLMSDQNGKIIDIPIQANFREGLSSIDYIVSSYGARKGIVDTALKTADSGYLTRRLIYTAQDLIIREVNCKTTTGVHILLNENTDVTNIVGASLLMVRMNEYPYESIYEGNMTLTVKELNNFQKQAPLILTVGSSVTCKSLGSLCQSCYGWDLAKQRVIGLGEAVGTIAAQAIGEPGTQLTMRTFHTGGIFTSEMVKQVLAPFSGKMILPPSLKTISYRTSHGAVVFKLQQDTEISIINWKGVEETISLDIGSYLYLGKSSFVKEGQLLAEYSTQSSVAGQRRLKPIYTSVAGEIRFESLMIRKMSHDKRIVTINQENGVLWIASGKIFPLPIEANYLFPKVLQSEKAFAKLKIVSFYQGIVLVKDGVITIQNQKEKILLEFSQLTRKITNCSTKFVPLVQNYHYIDAYTVLMIVELFPEHQGAIYSVRQKESLYVSTLFLITESDIWKVNSDQVNDYSFFPEKRAIVRSGTLINTNSRFSCSGFFLKKDGFKMIFQHATPIFLSRGTILNYKQGDFVLEKKLFATLVNYTQQTEDIVQGLPKIEQIVEARHAVMKTALSRKPGILLGPLYSSHFADTRVFSSGIHCKILPNSPLPVPEEKDDPFKKKRPEKNTFAVGHSTINKKSTVFFNNRPFRVKRFSYKFDPVANVSSTTNKNTGETVKTVSPAWYKFINRENGSELLSKGSKLWFLTRTKATSLYHYENKTLHTNMVKWATIGPYRFNNFYNNRDYPNDLNPKRMKDFTGQLFFSNRLGDRIVDTSELGFVLLERLHAFLLYSVPLSSQPIFQPGSFVDIGEPLTEGTIDIHELLNVFFDHHLVLDGVMEGTLRTVYKFRLLVVNSIQAIYQSQGVNISSKHIEIIARQMTSKVEIKSSGSTPFFPGEQVKLTYITQVYQELKRARDPIIKTKMSPVKTPPIKTPKYAPILISATSSSLGKDGFLSAAGFQETKRVLTKAALLDSTDWLRGLKESIIVGKLIPSGSSFLNYKNNLDDLYLFKKSTKDLKNKTKSKGPSKSFREMYMETQGEEELDAEVASNSSQIPKMDKKKSQVEEQPGGGKLQKVVRTTTKSKVEEQPQVEKAQKVLKTKKKPQVEKEQKIIKTKKKQISKNL